MKKITYLLILTSFLLSGCTSVEQQMTSWEVQTVESTVNCITTKGLYDPLETTIELNTQYCFQLKGFMGLVYDDQFLRVFIQKSSKDVIAMQVYNSMYTQEGRWPNPTSVSFLIGDEVKRVDAKTLNSDVDCGAPGADLYGCLYENDVVFKVTAEIFEEARRLKNMGKNRFTYRINNRSISDKDRFFHVNELLGLEEKIKRSKGVTNEPKKVDQSQVLNQIEGDHTLCSGLTDFVSLRRSYGIDSQNSYYDNLVKDSNKVTKKVPRYREKNIPDLNKIVTVNIGDEMVIQRTETELLTLESSHPEKMPFLHGRIPLPKQFSPVSLGVSFNADGLIKEVFDNTIADLLGLKQGDEILSLQGKKFESIVSVREVLLDSEKDNIVVTARRNGGVIYLNGKNENVLLPSNNRAELVNVELNENCLIPHDSQLEKTVVFRDYFARNHLSKTLSSRPISCLDDYCSQNSLSIAEGVWDLVSEGQYGNFYFLPKESSVNIDQSMGWSERKTYKLHPKWHIYMPNANATHTELATVQLADERSSTPIILTIPKSGLPATTPAVQSFTTPNATQQTLYYNGLSGNTLRFTYREFKEDMARDAFTQDVTYDLKLGEVIGFKSSRFKIIEADNLTITYQVLTHF